MAAQAMCYKTNIRKNKHTNILFYNIAKSRCIRCNNQTLHSVLHPEQHDKALYYLNKA